MHIARPLCPAGAVEVPLALGGIRGAAADGELCRAAAAARGGQGGGLAALLQALGRVVPGAIDGDPAAGDLDREIVDGLVEGAVGQLDVGLGRTQPKQGQRQ